MPISQVVQDEYRDYRATANDRVALVKDFSQADLEFLCDNLNLVQNFLQTARCQKKMTAEFKVYRQRITSVIIAVEYNDRED